MELSDFSEYLAQYMKERKVNQVELAKISGIKQQLISSYIRGSKTARLPSFKNLIRLANALDCSIDQLIGLDDIASGKTGGLDLTGDSQKIVEAYNRLPETDWRREAIKEILGLNPKSPTL